SPAHWTAQLPAPSAPSLHAKADPLRQISSNLQRCPASNLAVSSQRKVLIVGGIAAALSAIPWVSATPIDSGINIPSPTAGYVPAQLSGRMPRNTVATSEQTFERYGPQATERAVRSSLKVALVPDPLAMGALIFCAFALRWIRQRRSENPARAYPAASHADAVARAA